MAWIAGVHVSVGIHGRVGGRGVSTEDLLEEECHLSLPLVGGVVVLNGEEQGQPQPGAVRRLVSQHPRLARNRPS